MEGCVWATDTPFGMGVKGLWELLSPCGHRVNVEQLGGQTVAVDVSIWLYQFMAAMRDGRTGEVQPNAPCLGVFRRCLKLLFHGVRPVFVFDGATPALKKRTVTARRRRRDTQRLNLKRTAEKLLVNELKRRAVEEAARGKGGKDGAAGVGGGEEEVMVSTLPAGASGRKAAEAGAGAGAEAEAGNHLAGDAALAASLAAEADFEAAARFLDEDSEGGGEGDVEDDSSGAEEARWQRRYMSFSELQRGEMQRTGALPAAGPSSGMGHAAAARLAESLVAGGDHHHPRKKRPLAGGFHVDGLDDDATVGEPVDPEVLAALPPSLQLEVVDEARNRLRASMAGKYVAAAEEPAKFSSLQVDAFLKSSRLKRGLEVARETFNREQEAKELAVMRAEGRELPADVVAAQQNGAEEEGGAILVRRPVAGDKNASFVFTSSKATYRQREVAAEARLARTSASEREASRRVGNSGPAGPRPAGNVQGTGLTSSSSSSEDDQEEEIKPFELSGDSQGSDEDVEWEDADPDSSARDAVVVAAIPKKEEVSMDIKVELRSGDVQGKPGTYHDSIFSADMFRTPTAPAVSGLPVRPVKEEKGATSEVEPIARMVSGSQSSEDIVWEEDEENEGEDAAVGATSPVDVVEDKVVDVVKEEEEAEERRSEDEKPPATTVEEPKPEADVDPKRPREGGGVDADPEPAVQAKSIEPVADHGAGVGLSIEESSDSDGEVVWEEPPPPVPAPEVESPTAPVVGAAPTPSNPAAPPAPAQASLTPAPPDVSPAANNVMDEEKRQAALEEMRAGLEAEGHALRREVQRQAQQSTEVTAGTYEDVQELLTLFGIPYIVSPAEAEAQCAVLNAQGLVDGVVTDDNDVFLFGARVVYRNLFDAKSHVERYEMDAFASELGLSRARLIQLALLLGSDYSTGVHGVGVVNAMEVLTAFRPFEEAKEGSATPEETNEEEKEFHAILRGLSAFRDWATDVSGVDLPGGAASAVDDATWGALGEDFARKHRGGRRGWQFGDDFPSIQVVDAFRNPQCDRDLEGFEWGRPDVEGLRVFCRTRFGWDAAAVDTQLGPVLKKLDDRVMQTRIDQFFFSQRFAKFASKRIAKAIQGFAASGKGDGAGDGMDTELLVTATALAAMESEANAGKDDPAGDLYQDEDEAARASAQFDKKGKGKARSKDKPPLRGVKRPRTRVQKGG